MDRMNKRFLIKAGLVVGGGGLIFGYDIGVISTTITAMKRDIEMDPLQEGVVMGIMGAGACLGAIVGGPLCDYIGRWKTIQLQNLLFCVGSIVTAASANLTSLCIGRFIIGVASVVSSIADVPYLTEISPSSMRGRLTCTYELMTSFGVLLAFACGWLLCGGAMDDPFGWRVAYLIPVVLSLAQSLSMVFMPESPKWLLEKRMITEARQSLSEVYGSANLDDMVQQWTIQIVEKEGNIESPKVISPMVDISPQDSTPQSEIESGVKFEDDVVTYCEQVNSQSRSRNRSRSGPHSDYEDGQEDDIPCDDGQNNDEFSWESFKRGFQGDLKVIKQYQYPLVIVLGIQALTQLSGGVVVRNYADSLFQMEGASAEVALGFTAIMGAVKFIFTAGSVYMLDIAGRKILFVGGCLVVAAGMFILVLASTAASGSDSESERAVNISVQVTAIALVVGGYGIGYGPIAWILSSELFPVLLRGKVMALALICQNVFLLVTNLVFLLMLDSMNTAGTFGFFLAVNIVGAALCFAFLVESKLKSPETILLHLRNRLKTVLLIASIDYHRVCEESD